MASKAWDMDKHIPWTGPCAQTPPKMRNRTWAVRGISKLMISPGSLPISCGGSEAVAGMPEGSTTWKDVGCTSGASPTPGGLCGSIKSMGPLATLTHGLDRCRNGELVGALRRCPRASPRRHSAANSSPSQSRWSFSDRDSIFRVTQTDPYRLLVILHT